jgi:hypothetical protein
MRPSWLRWVTLAAALLLLNASLTIENRWPTPAIRWQGEVSIELAVSVLLMATVWRVFGRLRGAAPGAPGAPGVLTALSTVWLFLVIGRYADVTAPALYGREINLYWDVRYVSAVAGMLTRVAPPGLVVLVSAAAALVLVALVLLIRWSLGRVGDGLGRSGERGVLVVAAATVALLFAGQTVSARFPRVLRFATPVTSTYARQVRLVMNARAATAGSHVLAPSPPMHSDLALVKGADVFLVFLESYGAVAYERPEFNAGLVKTRAGLASAIQDTNRDVVSAYVESPTFGGGSWLAHISLLSGIEVRDPDTDALLLTQRRDTLAKAFARGGYRTIAWMPGLKQAWPEGSFYGFDEIYGAKRLDYHGPEFGWFAIPDQFALARLDQAEVDQRQRPPLFVFFPTLSTHTPFNPAPPYQPDWDRVLTDRAYDQADVDRAFDQEIDWMNLGPSYVDAVAYAYTVIGGYLRLHADRDFVLIVVGDHQPPALVSGQGAPWDVPVHVIACRSSLREQMLDRLRAHGFRSGVAPERPAIGHMHTLLPMLLDAFGRGD